MDSIFIEPIRKEKRELPPVFFFVYLRENLLLFLREPGRNRVLQLFNLL